MSILELSDRYVNTMNTVFELSGELVPAETAYNLMCRAQLWANKLNAEWGGDIAPAEQCEKK